MQCNYENNKCMLCREVLRFMRSPSLDLQYCREGLQIELLPQRDPLGRGSVSYGLPIPQLVHSSSAYAKKSHGLAGLPIPQLVHFYNVVMVVMIRLAGLPIPQLVHSSCRTLALSTGLAGLPIPQLVHFFPTQPAAPPRLAGLPIPQLVH